MTACEEWRPIVGYEGLYEVSSHGRIWSIERVDSNGHPVRGRQMKVRQDRRGRCRVHLSLDGKLKTHSVHRLVARAFLGAPPFEGAVVRHLNDTPSDNRRVNLVYGSHSDNSLDAVRNGVHPQSRKVHCGRGHPLFGDNLLLRTDGLSRRRCLACQRAAYTKYRNQEVEFDMQSLSDAHYRVIMTDPAGRLSTEEKMNCTITEAAT